MPTGTETYSSAVIEELVSRGRFELVLYLRPADRASPAWIGARVVRSGPPRMWSHLGLGREVALSPPGALFVPAHVMPVVCRPPAVVTVHDLGHRAHPRGHTWKQVRYLEWSTRSHVRRARVLVADSEATRRDLHRWYGRSHGVVVAPLGVDGRFAPQLEPAKATARRALGVPAGRRYIVHIGTLQPRKNLLALVRAFALLAADHPDLDLVLVGRRGWGSDDPVALAERLGLGSRVRCTGYVPAALLPGVYSGAEVTVLPSLYEGFGLTALESMACGTPVAASARASIPEVVGDAGVLFDPRDAGAIALAVRTLLEDADLRARLAGAGVERAARFTWTACAAAIESAVDQAMSD
jgi:glycosyltransferase involved in cell wall biosynthesis